MPNRQSGFRIHMLAMLLLFAFASVCGCQKKNDDDDDNDEDSPVTNQGIYAVGGIDDTRGWWRDVWRYRISNNSWESRTMSDTYIGKHACVLSGSAIYVVGGEQSSGSTNDIWKYAISTGAVTHLSTTDAPTARTQHTAVLYNNEIYVFGGYDSGYDSNLYAYSIENDTWRTIAVTSTEKPAGRGNHSAVVYNGKMYMYGGRQGSTILDELWTFEFGTQAWTQLEGYSGYERYGHSAVVYGDFLYIIGGINTARDYVGSVLAYNLASPAWSQKNLGLSARAFFGAAGDGSGNIYVLGGYDGLSYLRDFWRYNISENAWYQMASATNERAYMNAVYFAGD